MIVQTIAELHDSSTFDTMAIQRQTLLINARLVGRPPGLYAVLVTDGRIEKIVDGDGLPHEPWGGVEAVECRQADGTSLFVSPVSLIDEGFGLA